MLDHTLDHLLHNVLAAAADYEAAERDLTIAFEADNAVAAWEASARTAKRRAAEVAIAIDGLADRCKNEHGSSYDSDTGGRLRTVQVARHRRPTHRRARPSERRRECLQASVLVRPETTDRVRYRCAHRGVGMGT